MSDNYFIPTIYEDNHKGRRAYDLFSKLLEQRIIFVTGEVRTEMANLIVAQLLYLESVDNKLPIFLYINSPGGSVIDGLEIIDTMNFIKPKVGTICTGMAASMGFAILSSGEKGMRYSLPNTSLMAHRVSSGARGVIQDMEVSFEHSKFLDTKLANMISTNIGMDTKKYLKAVDRDKWLTPEEGLTFGVRGVIDHIVINRESIH